ncbi:Fic family protein [Actinoplanes sp. NPDC051346]|uniref:Fic family protein n=1 Tax=Actinoplanes sp. NPDC051346 TaxID=3155048 RepID=UPI003437A8AB
MVVDDAWKRISPNLLSWSDVDPARHRFDAGEALDVVRAVAPPVPPRPTWTSTGLVGGEEAERWRDAVSHALVDRYGRWASGWCWTVGEGDLDGGPVGAWCCVADSIAGPEETLALVAEALCEWRDWLEQLAGRFHRFLPLPDRDADPDGLLVAWELAVAQVVTATVDRTNSDSGWYGHCEQVLGWLLTAAGVPEDSHAALITSAVGGRFESWVEPSRLVVTDVAERLAREVTGRAATARVFPADEAGDWPDTWPRDWPSIRGAELPRALRPAGSGDSLTAWQTVRARIAWASVTSSVTGPIRGDRDGIADYVAQRPDGGEQLSAALVQARRAAAEGGPLTFARLAEWQRTVLGVPLAEFRTGPAVAKGGRERYHWRADLPKMFERCLAEATDDAVPLPSRAARVYLDVAFFHPFDDGNARSAMLALSFVLARDDVLLDRAAPLLATVRRADDPHGAVGLADLIDRLIHATWRGRRRGTD